MGALALLAVTAASLGVPLPAGPPRRMSERFPCEDCLCGCPDAESCWRECCCFTAAEKLAWAEERGVTPPKTVLAAARRERVAAALVRHDHEDRHCDSHACRADSSCCDEDAAPGADASGAPCAPGSSCELACCERPGPTGKAPRTPLVNFVAAMRCRGIRISVTLLPPSLPVDVRQFALAPPVEAESVQSVGSLYDSPVFDVATPPPNVG